jgi:universal stress protein A
MTSGRTILCPVDFSDQTEIVLREAIEQTEKFNGTLIILHVLNEALFDSLKRMQGRIAALDVNGVGEDAIRALGDERESMLREVLAAVDVARVKHTSIISRGYPFEEILKIADENKVDLIVLGTHGRHSLARQLHSGSQAEKVFRRAKCNVMFVR